MTFDEAFAALLQHEGEWSNHAADPGGKTRWGITEMVARSEGYKGEMREYPLTEAKKVYKRRYWDAMRLDEIRPELRFDLFDTAVNSGVNTATLWVQRVLRVKPDGIMGPVTLQALATCDAGRFAARYNGHRLMFMTGLPTWPSFGRGWARRIATNLLA